jgi:hypothetical protein
MHSLATADTFEGWEEAAYQLDELLSTDLWYILPGLLGLKS